MKRGKYRFVAGLVALLASLAGVAVTASPAEAASSCYGDYCSGRDPQTTGVGGVPCANGATTVASIELRVWTIPTGAQDGYWRKVGVLDLRWSNRCGTNWARASMSDYSDMDTVGVTQDTGYTQTYDTKGLWSGSSPGVFWTNMIYSPVARCRAWVSGGSWQQNSTDWR